jgi:uncharacterized membrane protein
MMVWNLVLAILPLLFSELLIKRIQNPKKGLSVLLGFLWLLFFPNAPYMITDFIHLNAIDFFPNQYYTTNLLDWIRLTHIGAGVFLGILSGLLSLYNIHRLLIKRKSKIATQVILVVISLLSGYAIYVGRFLRLNSWDILSPISLAVKFINGMTLFSLFFSLLMAIFILFSYYIFYLFCHLKNITVQPEEP